MSNTERKKAKRRVRKRKLLAMRPNKVPSRNPITLKELLSASREQIVAWRLAGPNWTIEMVWRALFDFRQEFLAIAPDHIRKVISVLRSRFPYAWSRIVDQSAQTWGAAIDLASAARREVSPTPFLPHLIHVAFLRSRSIADSNDLKALRGYSAAVLAAMCDHAPVLPVLAALVHDTSLVYRVAGRSDLSSPLLAAAEAIVDNHMQRGSRLETACAHHIILEASYDLLASTADAQASVEDTARAEAARSLLNFVESRLAPALDAVEVHATDPSRVPLDVLEHMRSAQSYRRMSAEDAVARAKRQIPKDRSCEWAQLAGQFRDLGDWTNFINVLTVPIDSTLEILEKRPDQELKLKQSLKQSLDAAEAILHEHKGNGEDRRAVLLRLAVGRLRLGCPEASAVLVAQAMKSLEQDLANASDDCGLSYLLRDGDDWLGVAFSSDDPPGAEFAEVYRTLQA